MATEDQILAILTGRKVFDGRTWRVYDAGGTELVDTGGVLWRGVHGALLWNANWRQDDAYPDPPDPRDDRRARITRQNQMLITMIMTFAADGAFQ